MRNVQAYKRAYCLAGTPITCSSMGSTLAVVLGVTGRILGFAFMVQCLGI